MTESEEHNSELTSTTASVDGVPAETATPQAEPAAATEPAPEPAAATEPEPRTEPKPEPKAEPKPERKAESRAESGERKKEKGASPVPAMVSKARLYVSRIIWIICVLAALVLAVGALLIALQANKHNGLVKGVLDLAKVADVGLFSLDSPIKQFHPPHAHIKIALLNYGIGALAWLVVGRIVASIVRPRS